MNWIKKTVAGWVREVNESQKEDINKYDMKMVGIGIRKDHHDNTVHFYNPLQITVYNAIGGKIIKFTRYDHNRDTDDETLYLIHADQNIDEEIGKFITLETLKNG